ncbi:MAG: hypothetical protein R6U98_35550, partial [Pirellulaceae bacterium]
MRIQPARTIEAVIDSPVQSGKRKHSDFRRESAGFVKDSGTGKASEKASARENRGNREGIESPERG